MSNDYNKKVSRFRDWCWHNQRYRKVLGLCVRKYGLAANQAAALIVRYRRVTARYFANGWGPELHAAFIVEIYEESHRRRKAA